MTVEQIGHRPEDFQYPIPEKSVKIPFKGIIPGTSIDLPKEYRPDKDFGYFIIRYVIGKDYQGPKLPKRTREILRMGVVLNDGEGTVHKDLIACADATSPNHSLWDRVVGYDEKGYFIWQDNGNAGRMVIKGHIAWKATRKDNIRTPGQRRDALYDVPKRLRVGGLPHYKLLRINETPEDQHNNPTYVDQLLGISTEFTPLNIEELEQK